MFGVHNDLSEVIRSRFGNTPKAAFDAILARMESDPAYTELMPAVALPHVFGWIAHSRYGLSVDEISALLTREGLVAKTEDAQDAVYLILRQLRPFLAKRDGRVDFFYESFKIAATERYTSGNQYARPAKDWHKSLAGYLETLPLENRHRLMEQAWQYYKAVLPEELYDLLNDAMYISAKQKGMLIDLLNDYDRFAEIHLPGQSDMSDVKERLRSLAPVLWEYPQISDQTLLGGLYPLPQLKRIEMLKEQICTEGGVELLGLGGDVYSSTGSLYLDTGRFLALSPNGKLMLAIDSAQLAVYDTGTFRQVHSYPAAIDEQQTFTGAISDSGKIALMDADGTIYSSNAATSAVSATSTTSAVSADKRFLLCSDSGGVLFVKDGNICSASGAVVEVIAKGIPSVICIKESRIAFVLDGEVHIYQYSDCQWACIASFPAAEPNSHDPRHSRGLDFGPIRARLLACG